MGSFENRRCGIGTRVAYGQIVKAYNNSEQPGRYGPPTMIDSDRRRVIGVDNLMAICTSHVERNNLTIRTFMKRFTRLSLGFSKKLENLGAAVALHVAYFNYCWRSRENHGGRQRLTRRCRRASRTNCGRWTGCTTK